MIPDVWTDRDVARHIQDCDYVVDVGTFSDAEPRPVCCCGEAARHTPEAVARAELDLLTTKGDG